MEHAMEVRGLRKRYGRVVAADDVDLCVAPGEVVGLLGRNGAGKTTTVECLAGLRRPDAGTVRVLGLDPRRDRAVRHLLGVQLQSGRLHDALTVAEVVRLHSAFHTRPLPTEELLATVGLTTKRDTRVERLSGGQQQRLSVAVAVLGRPRAVVLDEMTTGLDPVARRDMWGLVERLRDDGVAVLLVSHHMEEVERLCARVVLMDQGRVLADDTPAGLVARAAAEPTVASGTRTGDTAPTAPTTLDDAFLALTGQVPEPEEAL